MVSYKEVAKCLKKLDNYYIIVDNDPDGVCAGILIKIILNKLNKRFKINIRSKRVYKSLEETSLNFEYNNFIFLDTPFPDRDLINIAKNHPENIFIYIDHHKYELPKNIPDNLIYFDIRARGYKIKSVAAVVYKLGKIIIGEEFKKYSLIALIGSMCDWITDDETLGDFKETYKGIYTDDYNNITHIITTPLDIFKYGDLKYLLDKGDFLIENPNEFLRNLDIKKLLNRYRDIIKEVTSAELIYNGKNIIVFKTKRRASDVAGVLSTFYPDKITIVLAPIKYSFIEKIFPRKYKVSLRCRREDVHLGKVVEMFTKKYGINGGGHPKAAGAGIWKKDLEKFIEFVEKSVESEALH